jgi:hypothetical protein
MRMPAAVSSTPSSLRSTLLNLDVLCRPSPPTHGGRGPRIYVSAAAPNGDGIYAGVARTRLAISRG